MNNKWILGILAYSLLALGNPGSGQKESPPPSKQEHWENYLKTAKVVSVEIDPAGGRTQPWKVRLDDGKVSRQAVFKHVNRQRPTLLPDSFQYEIAAYELDKLLDFGRVPPVVERKIKRREGSLQLRLENVRTEKDRAMRNILPPDPEAFANALDDILIFEQLTYCKREDLGDILMGTKDWKAWRVDFSEAFFPSRDLIAEKDIERCSKKLYQNLSNLDEETVRAKLKPYLNEEELGALLGRKHIILNALHQLIQEKGEDAVLFD